MVIILYEVVEYTFYFTLSFQTCKINCVKRDLSLLYDQKLQERVDVCVIIPLRVRPFLFALYLCRYTFSLDMRTKSNLNLKDVLPKGSIQYSLSGCIEGCFLCAEEVPYYTWF